MTAHSVVLKNITHSFITFNQTEILLKQSDCHNDVNSHGAGQFGNPIICMCLYHTKTSNRI